MCLITENRIPKTSDKDIICYKIMVKMPSEKLETPYQHASPDKGNVLVAKGEKFITETVFGEYIVSYGYIHSFTNIEDAQLHMYCMKHGRKCIYEAVIPKGTQYLEGDFKFMHSYASDKIILKKEVDYCDDIQPPKIKFI